MTHVQTKTEAGTNDASIAPIRKSVRVDLTPAAAFERFTRYISDWWPLPDYSVGQEKASHVVFGSGVGEQVVEHLTDGTTAVWGTVKEWKPGEKVVFTWHPGMEPSDAQKVSVTFKKAGSATEVELVHTGWEVYGEKAMETRSSYDGGWDAVLAKFVTTA